MFGLIHIEQLGKVYDGDRRTTKTIKLQSISKEEDRTMFGVYDPKTSKLDNFYDDSVASYLVLEEFLR